MAELAMREFSAQMGESHDAMWSQSDEAERRIMLDEWKAILAEGLRAAPLLSSSAPPPKDDGTEEERWAEFHVRHREIYRLPPDLSERGLDLNAPSTSSDKTFTVREAEMRVIAAAMDWATDTGNSEAEDMALEMGIVLCLRDLAKAEHARLALFAPPAPSPTEKPTAQQDN